MDTLTKERPPLTDGHSNTPDRHHTALRGILKRIVCILALWGLLTPKAATSLLRALGLRDE